MSETGTQKPQLLGPFELSSPLPRAECVARLAAIARYQTSPLAGSVRERRFRVRLRYHPVGRIRVRNSFQPHLAGRLRDHDGGTIIRCHFTLHPLVLGILIYVCAFVALAVVLAQDWRVLPFLLFPLALTTLGCATSWGEREYVLDRVRAAIGARPT